MQTKDFSFLAELVAYTGNVRLAHWQADSVNNAHAALGGLYEAMEGLTDTLAEMVLGKAGSRELPGAKLDLVAGFDHAELVAGGLELVGEIRGEMEGGKDDDALNVLADMSAALNKAKYLLML